MQNTILIMDRRPRCNRGCELWTKVDASYRSWCHMRGRLILLLGMNHRCFWRSCRVDVRWNENTPDFECEKRLMAEVIFSRVSDSRRNIPYVEVMPKVSCTSCFFIGQQLISTHDVSLRPVSAQSRSWVDCAM